MLTRPYASPLAATNSPRYNAMSPEQMKVTPPRPALSPKRREQNRREFIRTSILGIGVLGATLVYQRHEAAADLDKEISP